MTKITNDIYYVGANSYSVDLFEGQFKVPNGMAYNSYIIMDEKTAVFDTADAIVTDQWFCNVKEALGDKEPDYIIVQHMEPDHSANLLDFCNKYPKVTVVSSAKSFAIMKNFFGTDFSDRRLIVGEGDKLSLGRHELTFITAPMVHWPEVIVTYDSLEKTLFSADAFGKFGAIADDDEDWAYEARRYYFGIVGKYGAQVQSLLKKAASLDIQRICPLHGPVLDRKLKRYFDLYNTWSSYEAETKGILIAYASAYGHTAEAALTLAKRLLADDFINISVLDISRDDESEAISEAFRYDRLVLAASTYNADVFPTMRNFLNRLVERGYKKRTIALIQNGSWAPCAAKVMRQILEPCRELNFLDTVITINSAVNDETREQLQVLAKELEALGRPEY